MNNLKSVTNLPFAESAEGLNLIVNDNGAAKQIAASAVGAQADWNEVDENSPSFIQNKPTKLGGFNRELVYEKHFTIEDDVHMLMEADANLKVFFEDGVDIFNEVETYGYNHSQGCGTDEFSLLVIGHDKCSKAYNLPFYGIIIDTLDALIYGWCGGQPQNSSGEDIELLVDSDISLINKAVITDEDSWEQDENNCTIFMNTGDFPIKSVKLYKITY